MVDRYFQEHEDAVLDLHGVERDGVVYELEEFFSYAKSQSFDRVRIITGKSTREETGPIVRQAVRAYLNQNGYSYNYASMFDGGEGALDVYLV
jgi:DNA-nicking Smr family endonuclease